MEIDFENIEKRLELLNVDTTLKAFISLQFQSGARVSDLLKVTYRNITDNLNVIIRQGKGSRAIIVKPAEFEEFWKNVRDNKLSPFDLYNRFSIYRLYKKIGISYDEAGKLHKSVTHAPRKLLAQDIYERSNEITDAQAALGHKSNNSTKYYLTMNLNKTKQLRGVLDNLSGTDKELQFEKRGIIKARRITPKRKRK